MNKKILVLGGSYLQSDFIHTGISLGYELHVLDMNPNCYASTMKGIIFKSINIADKKAVERYFVSNKCDTIISPITEIGNRVACAISGKLGLNYNSTESVLCTTDKSIMREKLKNHTGLNEPKTINFLSIQDTENFLSYPFIVKPPISSASRGVSFVNNRTEFEKAIKESNIYSKNINDILIEEYIDGFQYSIETITLKRGEHHVVALTKEILSKPPFFMERMDIISEKENTKHKILIKEYVTKLLNILDISVGPCHIEVKIKNNTIRLIEIASRSGMLRDRLIKVAKGVNYNKLIIDSYLGNVVGDNEIFLPKSNGYLGVLAYPHDYKVYKDLKKQDLIQDEYFYAKSLSINPKQLTDAVGYFFVESKDLSLFNHYKVEL